MKIAVGAGLLTKRDMQINSGQLRYCFSSVYFYNLMAKVKYGFGVLLVFNSLLCRAWRKTIP